MVFADDIVRVLLAVRRQVGVGEVVAGQALVTGDPSALENCERGPRQPTLMDFAGSQTRGGADRAVVRKRDVRELSIPLVLDLVHDHRQHLGHRVTYVFYPTVAVWVVRAGGDFPNLEKLTNDLRKL